MYKIIVYSLLFIIVTASAAYCKSFKATAFWYDPQTQAETAILTDLTTGNEWVVQKDYVIQGWTVVSITPEYVEISRYLDEQGYVAVHTLYFNDEGPILLKPGSNQ
ncbi:MAG: hypothetical protein ACOZBW_12320 [Thermodesulfobacteriota bacterium]